MASLTLLFSSENNEDLTKAISSFHLNNSFFVEVNDKVSIEEQPNSLSSAIKLLIDLDVIIYSDYVKASGEHYCYICSYMDICHVMHISDIDTFIKEESDNLYALLKDSIEPYSELAKVSDVSAIDTKFVLPNKFYLRDNKPVYAVVVAAILNQFRDTHSHGVFRDNYSDVIAVVTHAVKVNEQQEWEPELVFIEPDFFDDEDDDSNEAEPIDIELKDFEGAKVFADIKFPKIKEVNGLEKESDEVEIIFEDNPEIVKLTFYH